MGLPVRSIIIQHKYILEDIIPKLSSYTGTPIKSSQIKVAALHSDQLVPYVFKFLKSQSEKSLGLTLFES